MRRRCHDFSKSRQPTLDRDAAGHGGGQVEEIDTTEQKTNEEGCASGASDFELKVNQMDKEFLDAVCEVSGEDCPNL